MNKNKSLKGEGLKVKANYEAFLHQPQWMASFDENDKKMVMKFLMEHFIQQINIAPYLVQEREAIDTNFALLKLHSLLDSSSSGSIPDLSIISKNN